jgi:nucleotide-binding universal stress UspA family protein
MSPEMPGTQGVSDGNKRMLCATDLSPHSQRALQRAALLASQFRAQLIVLHVMEPDDLVERGARVRYEIARQLSSKPPAGCEPSIELRAGDCVQTIAAVAKETDVDLIVLGSRGHRPLAPLIGATAERITRFARRPALIVNLEPRARYDAVVIAAEISDAFVQVTRLATSLRLLDARSVSIVHGFESPYRGPLYAQGFDLHAVERNVEEWEKAARARLVQKLDAAGVESSRFRPVYQQTQPPRAIQRVIRRVQPELLIVGTKDRVTLNRMVRGSVANDVLRTLECDILVAPPDAEEVSSCTARPDARIRLSSN